MKPMSGKMKPRERRTRRNAVRKRILRARPGGVHGGGYAQTSTLRFDPRAGFEAGALCAVVGNK